MTESFIVGKNVSTWVASNPFRKYLVIRLLKARGEKSFSELLRELNAYDTWARQTLTLYLQRLVTEGLLKRIKQGKRVTYSISTNCPEYKLHKILEYWDEYERVYKLLKSLEN